MVQGWRREVAAFITLRKKKLLGPSDGLIGYGNKMKEKSMESYGFLNQNNTQNL